MIGMVKFEWGSEECRRHHQLFPLFSSGSAAYNIATLAWMFQSRTMEIEN
jgi:hypothetical protein